MINNKKKRILVIGYSYIAQKSIIPALLSHSNFQLVGIASNSRYLQIPKNIPAFTSYEEGIKKSQCDIVYISLYNSAHYQWIKYSLKMGKHVICDKPAVLTKKQAQSCYKLVSDKLLVFESLPYLFHKQHTVLKKYLIDKKYVLQNITAHFGFPPLKKENFRNFEKFGGGCIYDLGPYLISLGQFYFDTTARKVYCSSYGKRGSQIPISASITIHYSKNQTLQGFIGFNLEYSNHLQLWGDNFHYLLDRAFTTPLNLKNNVIYKSKNIIKNITVPPCNNFFEMFDFLSNLLDKKGGYQSYNKAFVERAIILETINKSAAKLKPAIIRYE